jgi:hypothetical protein
MVVGSRSARPTYETITSTAAAFNLKEIFPR